MIIQRFFVPGLAVNSYLVADEKLRKAALVDPVRDVESYVRFAHEKGLIITDIIETHVHADFVSGSLELKHALKGQPLIHCSAMGGQKWIPSYADRHVRDGDQITIGDLVLEAYHTPGHTPEHITWKLFDVTRSSSMPLILFTGDFLFVGEVGRPDLLGEEARKLLAKELYESLFIRLKRFPDFVEVYPAHGAGSLCGKSIGSKPTSTLGYERQFNPSFQKLPEEEWMQKLMEHMPKAPPYFPHMKQMNVRGPNFLPDLSPALLPQKVYQMQVEGAQILDVRNKEAFAAAHIPGAINIPLSPMLATYAGWIIPYDQKLILLTAREDDLDAASTALGLIGLDNVVGYLDGGINAWEQNGFPLTHIEGLSIQELTERLNSKNKPLVLDVRSEAEWLSGHIEHAYHYPLGAIGQELLNDVSKDQEICVICGSGMRSGIMASCLQQAGYKHVANVLGGMAAWKNGGLPVF